MRYISLQNLRSALSNQYDLTLESDRKEAFSELEKKSINGEVTVGKLTFSLNELLDFLGSYSADKQVFGEWIDQHKALTEILQGSIPAHEFLDSAKWKSNHLFSAFSIYLTPYLSSALLRLKENANIEQSAILLSFASLLPIDDRVFIEQTLYKPLIELVDGSKTKIATAETENALLEVLQTFCNEAATQMTNYLSRSSYSIKLKYVDDLLWVIRQKGCTIRLANWILKQLEKIELNPEHQEKILDLKKDLRQGAIKVQNANLAKSKGISFRSIMYLSGIFILLGFSLWIIWEKPFSGNDDKPFDTATSFQQFTKDERRKIDSLLREIQEENSPEENMIDPNQPILGNGISIDIRIPFSNKRMESLYRDLLIDVDLFDQGLQDSCDIYTAKEADKILYEGVRPLKDRRADIQLMLKNESGYDVYLIVFEDLANGKLFSTRIAKGTTADITMDQYDRVVFVAGNDLSRFIAPKGSKELPSKNFDHHFCHTDFNYAESIGNVYTLERPKSGNNKLLFAGDKNAFFTVIDLYSILDGF